MSNAPKNGQATKTGLKIDRVFSDPDVHPFDQIKWVERVAEIKDETGKAVFHQAGCEFPSEWSQLAVNVVASKYFYGSLGSGNGSPKGGKREYSVKQLVGRVARTIADWGWDDGYFDSSEDHEAFNDELTFLCLNQYGAFNSPVWFNVGLWNEYGTPGDYDGYFYDKNRGKPVPVPNGESLKHPQGSACFLVGVEDTISSIYERSVIEGRLFKYGSGCGSNNSKIRSAREFVRGGGRPSGPISFMSVYDAVAKVTKSGGRSRRAAKAELLDDWHPDVLEFIRCKGVEEAKAHALIREGYESNFNGEAYSTVCFQNSNMSVRFSDAFMDKLIGVDSDPRWQTIAVTTGAPFNTGGEKMPEYDVNFLFNEVAQGTWKCGDPGVMFTDTIQKWHTCKDTGAIECANPCMEFLFLTDTACNLAALNLIKFLNADGEFDSVKFKAAVRIYTIAQEIIVDRAGYPTEKICQNSHDYRPLGLGYCNIGALLMSKGLPYDSKEGRDLAAAITAIMDAQAHLTSCDMARVVGAFPGYERNRDSYIGVMKMHRNAAYGLNACGVLDAVAKAAWDEVVGRTAVCGARNAQTSLLMPTGTVAFMLDAATTGIEPDIALVKYKVLAGGGNLRYVNTVVPQSLKRLGYDDATASGIVEHIEANDTIEDAPGLKQEHVPVFDCAFPSRKDGRAIAWKGHIDMMAAVQPFLSGAISKTVNMPESSTVEDIRDAYVYAWKQGLKCVAIYRDGSKSSQPLNTKAEAKKDEPAPAPVPSAPRRERLPATRRSINHKFEISGHEGYINVGFYPDGRAGEIFVTVAKEGSTIGGLMDAWATAISIGLQYGVPLEVLVEKFAHSRFEPSGMSRNPDIPIAKSITDYISRWLGMTCIPGYREANAPNRDYESKPAAPVAVEKNHAPKYQQDSPACSNCGSLTIRAGSCYLCPNCATSSGCG